MGKMKIILFLVFLGVISCIHMRKHSDEDSDSNIHIVSPRGLVVPGGFTGTDVGGVGDLGEGYYEAYKFIEDSLDSIQDYDLYHV